MTDEQNTQQERPLNDRTLVDWIMDYEADQLSEEEIIRFFQYIKDHNLAAQLQGHYGRMVNTLTAAKFIH